MARKIKRNNNADNLTVEHIKTNLIINAVKCCSKCPIRIYAKQGETIVFGVGNITTDTIMVLPSYDINAKIGYNTILNILQKVYRDIKGTELLEDCYVTRTIKCLNKTDFNLEKDAIESCICNLYYEICRIRPKKIIMFDRAADDYVKPSIFSVKHVYSPGVMYYDNQTLKDNFIKQLKEALND